MPKTLIIGAGAIGLELAARLELATQCSNAGAVEFNDAGPNIIVQVKKGSESEKNLKKYGITVHPFRGDARGDQPIHIPSERLEIWNSLEGHKEALKDVSHVIFAMKTPDLYDANFRTEVLAQLLDYRYTLSIVMVQNGIPCWYGISSFGNELLSLPSIDSEGKTYNLLKEFTLIPTIVYGTSRVIKPGCIVENTTPYDPNKPYAVAGHMFPDEAPTKRYHDLLNMFAAAQIKVQPIERRVNVIRTIFAKLIFNACGGAVAAAIQSTQGAVFKRESAKKLTKLLVDTSLQACKSLGIDLPKEMDRKYFTSRMASMLLHPPSIKTDFASQKPTERASIVGAFLDVIKLRKLPVDIAPLEELNNFLMHLEKEMPNKTPQEWEEFLAFQTGKPFDEMVERVKIRMEHKIEDFDSNLLTPVSTPVLTPTSSFADENFPVFSDGSFSKTLYNIKDLIVFYLMNTIDTLGIIKELKTALKQESDQSLQYQTVQPCKIQKQIDSMSGQLSRYLTPSRSHEKENCNNNMSVAISHKPEVHIVWKSLMPGRKRPIKQEGLKIQVYELIIRMGENSLCFSMENNGTATICDSPSVLLEYALHQNNIACTKQGSFLHYSSEEAPKIKEALKKFDLPYEMEPSKHVNLVHQRRNSTSNMPNYAFH